MLTLADLYPLLREVALYVALAKIAREPGGMIRWSYPASNGSPKMTNIVFGASGMVGAYIVKHLDTRGEQVTCVSRQPRPGWITADLERMDGIGLPRADVVFCATNARIFAPALPAVLQCRPRRVVVISSSSVFTKSESKDELERQSILELINAEKHISDISTRSGVEWTILRPTLIYKEGQDRNVTQIARLIQRFRFMPLYGAAGGLRQPVHAEDLARGAVSAAKSAVAADRAYYTSGLETIPYREMVGRIFDALAIPRRMFSLNPILWNAAFSVARPLFPGVSSVMGERMVKDLAFDSSAAAFDFGWNARPFAPTFESI